MTAPKEFEAAYYAQEHLEAGLVLMELSLHETRSVSDSSFANALVDTAMSDN
jgi:hypothetical protein